MSWDQCVQCEEKLTLGKRTEKRSYPDGCIRYFVTAHTQAHCEHCGWKGRLDQYLGPVLMTTTEAFEQYNQGHAP